jgi:hypothetical protein
MNYKEYNNWLNRPVRTKDKRITDGAKEILLSIIASLLILASAYLLLFI